MSFYEVIQQKLHKELYSWHIKLCSTLKVSRCFGGTCCLRLQGRRISQTRNNRERRWLAGTSLGNTATRISDPKGYFIFEGLLLYSDVLPGNVTVISRMLVLNDWFIWPLLGRPTIIHFTPYNTQTRDSICYFCVLNPGLLVVSWRELDSGSYSYSTELNWLENFPKTTHIASAPTTQKSPPLLFKRVYQSLHTNPFLRALPSNEQ
jgi:hypothetical protein